MTKAYVELGYTCNNNCLHCFVPKEEKRVDLSTEEAKKVILSAWEKGFTVVALTGGEPTIRRDLFELVKYAHSVGFAEVELQTNGRLLSYPDFAARIAGAGFSKIGISIHAPVPDVHDRITRVPGSWEQTRRGIENVLREGAPVMTNTVIHRLNYALLSEHVEFLFSLGVKEIELDFVRYIGNARRFFDVIGVSMTEVRAKILEAFDRAKALGVPFIYIDDYPLCLTHGYERYNADSFGEGVHDEDAEHFTHDAPSGRPIHDLVKIHPPQCARCVHRAKCQGIWREYVEELFGPDEFVPVTRSVK